MPDWVCEYYSEKPPCFDPDPKGVFHHRWLRDWKVHCVDSAPSKCLSCSRHCFQHLRDCTNTCRKKQPIRYRQWNIKLQFRILSKGIGRMRSRWSLRENQGHVWRSWLFVKLGHGGKREKRGTMWLSHLVAQGQTQYWGSDAKARLFSGSR